MLGGKAAFMAQVETAVNGAHERFLAQKAQWQAAKDVVYDLVGTGVHSDKLARAELEVIEAHKRMAYEYNTIRQYHSLAIEQGAFDAQIAFLKPVEAEIEKAGEAMWALVAAGAFAVGGAIGGTTTFVAV